jgi:uncharacterized protein
MTMHSPVPPPPIPPAPPPARPDLGAPVRPGGSGTDGERPGSPSTATWRPWEALPVFLIGIVVGVILSLPADLLVHSRSALFDALTGLGEAGFGIAVIFWVRVVSKARLSALGVSSSPFRDVATGVVGGVALVVVAFVASAIVVTVVSAITGHAPKQPDQIPTYVTGVSLAISGLLVVLAAPFGEEFLFRGFLYNSLRRRWTTWPSALLSGALFALLHGAPILIVSIFPVGVGLALIYERRHSIVASLTAHATFNLIGFLFILAGRH